MVLHVGEDLFSTLLAVSLLSVFIAALFHSYHIYSERQNAFESFDLALDVAERLRDRVLAREGKLGLVEFSKERLESYSELLALDGTKLRVEIRSLDGELLFCHGTEPNILDLYLFPPASVCIPVAVSCENRSTRPCELTVQVWRV